MTKQMKSGGYGGLLYDLLNYELGMVNIYKIPMTKALRDQKELSMSPIYKFWLTCLMNGEISPADHGEWPSEIISQTFYEMFLTYARSLNIRHIPTQNEFFRDIKKAAPEDEIKRIRGKFVNGYRPWAYRLPTLVKARKYFDQMNGHAQDWPEEGNSSQVEDEIPF
jgi:hypothetical protein